MFKKNQNYKERNLVVTIIGHVNHGKTSLIDIMGNNNIAKKEYGEITQNIGIYNIEINKRNRITMIDTPGHEAFQCIRNKGCQITDIIIIIIAADEGIQRQTIESIKESKRVSLPIIIVINKIDKIKIDRKKIEKDLLKYGIITKTLGGDVDIIYISIKKNIGVDKLKEILIIKSKSINLSVNYNTLASGTIVETKINKHIGINSKILIKEGTLKIGDIIIIKNNYFKIKSLFDNLGKKIKIAYPSIPVIATGFKTMPKSGEIFHSTKREKYAKKFIYQSKDKEELKNQKTIKNKINYFLNKKFFYKKGINFIIKGETEDNLNAILYSLDKLLKKNIINIIYKKVGEISKSDIDLAKNTKSIIIGFNVEISKKMKIYIKYLDIKFYIGKTIYKVIEDIKKIINGKNENIKKKIIAGIATIREIIKIKEGNIIAGCIVNKGTINTTNKIQLLRDKKIIYDGKLLNLKRFKNKIEEVEEGLECGIYLKNFNEFRVNDIINSYYYKDVK